MSFNKLKNNSICVFVEKIISLQQIFVEKLLKTKKTGKPVKLLRSTCSTCKKNKSPIVSDQTIQAEGLGDTFKHLGKAAKSVGKKIFNNSGRSLEIAANIRTAAASKNPKLIAATSPDIINFVHQGKDLYSGKIQ